MVWGVPYPPGPYGEFERRIDIYRDGWRDRLMTYYQEQMPEEKKSYYGNASRYSFCVIEKFLYECGRKQPGPDDIVVTPIEAHEPPRFLQFERGNKSPAAMISLPSGALAASGPLKSFIEWLEPGVHQFFPFEIRNTRGNVYSVEYFLLVIGRYLESFVPERSAADTFRTSGNVTWYSLAGGSKRDVTGLALSKDKFSGAHLWRERAFGTDLNCFSDELMTEILDAGLKMPRKFRVKEV